MKMVKVMYVKAKQKNLISISDKELEKLPKKLILVYSLQYEELACEIRERLKKKGIKVVRFKQVLGCSNIYNRKKLPILLVSTGRFHAQNLYLQTPIIYIVEGNKIIKISNKEIDRVKKERKVALMKFLNAEKIGIIVSTKPGQENMKKALELKKKIERKYKNKKQVFLFISNNIDINEFENFDIDSWVNTACRGLVVDKIDMINYDELPKL